MLMKHSCDWGLLSNMTMNSNTSCNLLSSSYSCLLGNMREVVQAMFPNVA